MKETILIAILGLLPFIVSAQSIKDSGIDEFTGNPIICTSWTGLKTHAILPSVNSLDLEFMISYENDNIYFHMKWINSVNKIREGSELQFKMDDNSIITLHAIDDFSADVDVYTSFEKAYSRNVLHAVYLYQDNLSALANNNPINKIRINTSYGSKILELKGNNTLKIAKACGLVMDEIERY